MIPYKTAKDRDYILDIFTSGILKMTKGINKYTVTKQSRNWNRWCTLLTHTGLENKLLDGITQYEKISGVIILRISAKKPVWKIKEIQNPQWNCQSHHIGCIYVFTNANLEQPDPRQILKNLPSSSNYGATNQWNPPLNTRRPSQPIQCSTFTGNSTPT